MTPAIDPDDWMPYPIFGTDVEVYAWTLDAPCEPCGASRGEECRLDCPTLALDLDSLELP